ncbi:MAG: 3-methyl-2-oxobutanoate hydroxymethyltransferase [Candidatus Binatia bacterium]|nr:MAG: 3-methyl-2-oxobutanoate hydroxymethyltransferase [Candidatus Binatia bacterium]
MPERVTVPEILRRKGREKIVALTAYDFPFARLVDEAGVDLVLVGDSLGMVVQGLETTLPVTLEETIYHCRMVARARRRALLVGDLPFLTYQADVAEAVRNAGRLLKEGGCDAVKLEGGLPMAETIRALVRVDIPVVGHVGLTPQSIHRIGGYKVQGRTHGTAAGARERVLADARAVAEAGAFAVVLECVPMDLAEEITRELPIPTIGIGAGPHCDGQILVLHDLLGLTTGPTPRFVKRYAELAETTRRAVRAYAEEVRSGAYPTEAHAYHSLYPVERGARKVAEG